MTAGTPTLDQLRVLLAVAEAGSFSGAAKRLNRAQSVVSYGIANLEAQLGLTLFERIVRSGFVTYGPWTAGETLAWGTGSYGSPAGVVNMWMHSPDHRAILLSSSYRFVGIGRAYGTFQGYRGADIWTADWGHR